MNDKMLSFRAINVKVLNSIIANNRYTKYRWTLRLKTRQNPKDPFTADEYFC